MFECRSEICGSKQIFLFQSMVPFYFLNRRLYLASRGCSRRKIIQNRALLVTIHILATFIGQNLRVFLLRDLEENILGKF